MESKEWNINPILKMLLFGTISNQSSLRKLRGLTSTILKDIYQFIFLFWKRNIIESTFSPSSCGKINFPESKNININMMPFNITDINSLPGEYRQYWPLIQRCHSLHSTICYLTIHESFVKAGETQRRGGLHAESPGYLIERGKRTGQKLGWGGGFSARIIHKGGIYMASNINNSCRVFPYQLTKHCDIVGENGDIEFLREFFPKSSLLQANELVWITDTTPHEALPVTEDCYRQFFRVVGKLSAWYEKHSTPNPLGIRDESVKILTDDKFQSSKGLQDEVNDKEEKWTIFITPAIPGYYHELKIEVKKGWTIWSIKESIQYIEDIPPQSQTLMFDYRVLENQYTLGYYGIEDKSTLTFDVI